MWLYVAQGIGIGFTAAVVPGPFQTFIISQTLTRGWKKVISATLAPLITDGPIIASCLFVLNQVPLWLQRFLYIAGGLFILYLAIGAYKAWKDFDSKPSNMDSGIGQSLFRAVLMNFLSPGPYIYWSLVTGPILLKGWRETPIHGIGFLAGFYVTMISSLVGIILLFGPVRELGLKVNRRLIGISAVVLLCFGLYQLWLGITG